MLFLSALLLLSSGAHADLAGAFKALASGDFETAATELRPLAEGGDARAQLALGQLLRTPRNPKRSFEEAISWFTRAAQGGSADANFWLGLMHRLGESVPRSSEQAVQFWRAGAEGGSVLAQGALAQALMSGDGTARDPEEAVRWARQGAERNNPTAQNVLALAHLKGEGGATRSVAEFLRWTRRAANQGNRPSMESLAMSYQLGTGVAQDFVQAHMWANLAAARGSPSALKQRDELAAKMTPEQIAEAQKLASRWRPTIATNRPPQAAEASGRKRIGTASGFVVGLPGYVLTNHHVVNQCAEIRAPASKAVLRVVAQDERHDLALLEGEFTVSDTARFRTRSTARLGESVIVAGYPLSDLLSASLNVTTGSVSALTGPKNDASLIQITAPIQRGNSGGPVLDEHGEVIGVVVSKLNALRVAMVTGDIPQNVNFAVTGTVARSFLEANGVEFDDIDASPPRSGPSTTNASERARRYTLLIECWR